MFNLAQSTWCLWKNWNPPWLTDYKGPVWCLASNTAHKNGEGKWIFLHKFFVINSFSLRGCGSLIWDILELSGYNAMCSGTTLLEQRDWTIWPTVILSKVTDSGILWHRKCPHTWCLFTKDISVHLFDFERVATMWVTRSREFYERSIFWVMTLVWKLMNEWIRLLKESLAKVLVKQV